jgi:DNA-directed RNA polymerase subunit beta'
LESFNSLFQPARTQAVNDFNAIKISLASPEKIRSWSYGEVVKPETINYRTFKPERDGLFCAKIFGPITDWECLCGKYKRMKHRGVICDKCGVEVTKSKVRRERMGHIELASPVSHVWFFKGLPSRIGHLLDITLRDLERILYFESYVVIDPGDLEEVLAEKDLLTEERYRELRTEYGDVFVAKMGAEAIKELLMRVEVEELSDELRLVMRTETSQIKKLKAAKRLKVVDAFRKSGHRPEWMILDVIPVIPPELRPLVPLDGGRFATSDLNDLYRRVINRNNRLKKLLELRAPDVIVRNEKRMLQEAVDALFDNGRRGRVLKGSNNRPLKSLSDTLKGKQGRFRQNLLGKRVDYSGRSVIVIGPELKLHQCGLPKKMALELFKPFIYHRLEQKGLVGTIKAAKEMVELQETEVWDALDEVIREHPVLLNRAPTLHRLGIQAFEPVLVEGKAIKIHPLVCAAFNADFDGDQMAVHLPLSPKAQVEAQVLMLAANNILSPANGKPVAVPSQDLVLGGYYLTMEKENAKGAGKTFGSDDEALLALEAGVVELLTPIRLRMRKQYIDLTTQFNKQDVVHAEIHEPGKLLDTTVGRVVLNMHLPEEIPFVNGIMQKKAMQDLINFVFINFGNDMTVRVLDELKEVGFLYATLAGISIGVEDMVIPTKKEAIVDKARKAVLDVERQRLDGAITQGERHNKIIDIWHRATELVSDEMFADMRRLEKERGEFNPIFMMADSGARGSKEQVRQLAGMRGLMSKPSGEVIETPITANFREGLSVLQYFISTHGARKGLADTALKTADSGYLTRRLVDVAQDVIVTETDCSTFDGIIVSAIMEGGDILEPLRDRVIGRVSNEDIYDPLTAELIVEQNQEFTEDLANQIQEAGIEQVRIRSVLTCETRRGVCQRCYGRNLATGRLVEIGEAVGVIAAESIGEPGTQLTMRTFHVGGTASRVSEQSRHESTNPGIVQFHNVNTVTSKGGDLVVINRNGKLLVLDDKGREKERYQVVYGSTLKVHDGEKVKPGQVLVEWDPFTSAILSELGGKVEFRDIVEGENVREETDRVTGLTQMVIGESLAAEKRTPTLIIKGKKGQERKYLLPIGAHLIVGAGQEVHPGDIIAKIPRATTKTKDITGGLPRVVELFEARHPREKAIITEVDGVTHHGPVVKGMRKLIVETEAGEKYEYSVPRHSHINVQEGEHVRAGDALIDGSIDPHDVLAVLGVKELQRYLVDKIQEVYRSQSVAINDKHIEVIVRQMLRSVKVTRVGDTDFLIDEQVDRFRFIEENEKVIARGGEPADGTPMMLGITKASLSTESFISAASFQETTRVLTEASISGRVDYLRGLKENVIVGRLIPAGTGMKKYSHVHLEKDEPVLQLGDEYEPAEELALADFEDEQ